MIGSVEDLDHLDRQCSRKFEIIFSLRKRNLLLYTIYELPSNLMTMHSIYHSSTRNYTEINQTESNKISNHQVKYCNIQIKIRDVSVNSNFNFVIQNLYTL